MDQPRDYDREADALAFDAITRGVVNENGERFSKQENLEPGLYAAKLVRTESRMSMDYGPQIRIVLHIYGTVDENTKAPAEWRDYGLFSTLISMNKKADKIAHLLDVYDELGAVCYDGRRLEKGGDLLRCPTPQRFVNVRVCHYEKTHKNFIADIFLPFYNYEPEYLEALSSAEGLPSAQPQAPLTEEKKSDYGEATTEGSGSSFLQDVPF